MSVGGLLLGVASETDAARAALAEGPWAIGDADAREGMLIGQPAAEGNVGSAAWVLYESGDIVLRRARGETEVVTSLLFHLASVEHAATTPLLPLRVRPIVLADGSVVLAAAAATSDLAGHDRRLARRGAIVLPTVVTAVDPRTGSVHLPAQTHDPVVPAGTAPLKAILLRTTPEPPLGRSTVALAIARTVFRSSSFDVRRTAEQVATLSAFDGIELLSDDEIRRRIDELAGLSTA